jgi:hypothetical protein
MRWQLVKGVHHSADYFGDAVRFKFREYGIVNHWGLKAQIRFSLRGQKLPKLVLICLNQLDPDHPLLWCLDVLQHPTIALRRRYREIREEEAMDHRTQRLSVRSCLCEARDTLLQQLNQQLSSYRMSPLIWLDGENDHRHQLIIECKHTAHRLREFQCLAAMLALMNDGRMWSLKRCIVCGQLMQARQRSQKYCRKNCRQNAWQRVPEVRAKKAAARRRRYQQEKERDHRALQLARAQPKT